MWNIASDPRHNVENNKSVTPKFDVKFPFPVASDNGQLEEDIMEFQQEVYDGKLDEFHEKVGLVFNGEASENVLENLVNKLI